jgi:hypothetical protein
MLKASSFPSSPIDFPGENLDHLGQTMVALPRRHLGSYAGYMDASILLTSVGAQHGGDSGGVPWADCGRSGRCLVVLKSVAWSMFHPLCLPRFFLYTVALVVEVMADALSSCFFGRCFAVVVVLVSGCFVTVVLFEPRGCFAAAPSLADTL